MGERFVMTDGDLDRDIAESEAEYEQRRQSMVKAKSADGRLSCMLLPTGTGSLWMITEWDETNGLFTHTIRTPQGWTAEQALAEYQKGAQDA